MQLTAGLCVPTYYTRTRSTPARAPRDHVYRDMDIRPVHSDFRPQFIEALQRALPGKRSRPAEVACLPHDKATRPCSRFSPVESDNPDQYSEQVSGVDVPAEARTGAISVVFCQAARRRHPTRAWLSHTPARLFCQVQARTAVLFSGLHAEVHSSVSLCRDIIDRGGLWALWALEAARAPAWFNWESNGIPGHYADKCLKPASVTCQNSFPSSNINIFAQGSSSGFRYSSGSLSLRFCLCHFTVFSPACLYLPYCRAPIPCRI